MTGLLFGITLKNLGYNVTILERQETHVRQSQAAGIGLSAKVENLFKQNDIPWESLGIKVETVQQLALDGSVVHQVQYESRLTAWSVLYYRLRAHFDGFYTPVCPQEVPPPKSNNGTAVYSVGKRVTAVERSSPNDTLTVTYVDTLNAASPNPTTVSTDLVVAANGGTSFLHHDLGPDLQRPYSGYLAWRGCVQERHVSDSTRKLLSDRMTSCPIPDQGYVLTYTIPSEAGDISVGNRQFNLLWYSVCPSSDSLYVEAMTDAEGHRHNYNIPAGRMNPDVWQRQCEFGRKILPDAHAELVNKIEKPFITAISDFISPRASYHSGRLLLVGEAFALHRPHNGLGMSLAAEQATLLADVMCGTMSLEAWEGKIIDAARENHAMSVGIAKRWMGSAYPHDANEDKPEEDSLASRG